MLMKNKFTKEIINKSMILISLLIGFMIINSIADYFNWECGSFLCLIFH
jgi:hypothetical protein